MPKKESHINRIISILKTRYPHVKTQLDHRNAFELLIATILSAQCTDRQVNQVTGGLFARFPTPATLAEAAPSDIEAIIRPTGYYRNKARNIKACAAQLVEKFKGEVPPRLADLVTLPGVGRKTANVVLGAVFGIPGIVVDTHVARISRRLGLTAHQDPGKIELDLMAVIPETEWNDFSLRLIYFGREICTARKPACPVCPLNPLCPYPDKTR